MDFTLDVPANAEQLRTIRLFVATIARKHGCDDGSVEDLKLAVSEAGNIALAFLDDPHGDRLWVGVDLESETFSLQLSGHRNGEPVHPGPTLEGEGLVDNASMGKELISALFPQARVGDRAGGPILELSLAP